MYRRYTTTVSWVYDHHSLQALCNSRCAESVVYRNPRIIGELLVVHEVLTFTSNLGHGPGRPGGLARTLVEA